MVNEIRIYIEGGGDDELTKAFLREGFNSFLQELVTMARSKRIKWRIIACGRRDRAFSDFLNALQTHTDAFNILLVDSEGPVSERPWQHLEKRDRWKAGSINDQHCHMMVQMMESWLIADSATLRKFYGQDFKENAIPKNPNVEQLEKNVIMTALKDATRNTSKGEYHKTRHGFKILGQLDVAKVRKVAPHCDRFFKTLLEKMSS